MLKFFKKAIKKLIKVCGYEIHKTTKKREISQWVIDKGDKTHRLFYKELNKDSLVFDLGGYEGQWASDIYSIYRCRIKIFEPVKIFAINIKHRFERNKDIIVYDFGLGERNKKAIIKVDETHSSIYKQGGRRETIFIKKMIDFVYENNIKRIDLIKINIEGAENELLEHIIESGFIKNIINIQVQFHKFIPNSEKRMRKIQKELSKTHELTFQYPFIWENWKLKKGSK